MQSLFDSHHKTTITILVNRETSRTLKKKSKVKGGKALPIHDMKTYRGIQADLYRFLTSALDRCKWSTSCPGRFTPRKKPLPTEQEAGLAQEPA